MKPIRSTREMLELCNVDRAKRREPVRRLDRLTNAEQRAPLPAGPAAQDKE